MADQMIRSGQHQVVVAGGMESMTGAPHVLLGARQGYKYGNAQAADILDQDALVCAFDAISMGEATEKYGTPIGISREEQDAFAARSHQLAAEATASGRFAEEIVPVEVKGRKGSVTITEDEGIRPQTTTESLGGLRPAFAKDGTITAGNASQLSDGAAALVVTSKEWAQEHGLTWIAEIRAHGEVAGPDPSLLLQPANAIKDALRRDGEATAADLDVVEINEAFASVGHRLDARPRARPGDRQRAWRRDRPRTPGGHERGPDPAQRGLRAQAPRRRPRARSPSAAAAARARPSSSARRPPDAGAAPVVPGARLTRRRYARRAMGVRRQDADSVSGRTWSCVVTRVRAATA